MDMTTIRENGGTMKKYNWNGSKRMKAAGILLASLVLTGCGKSTENINIGMQAIEKLEYTDALAAFENAIVQNEDLELAYRGQGMVYLGQSQYEEAIASFENALSHAGMFVTDTEVDINHYLATAQYKSGKYEDAMNTLNAIARVREKEADVYFMRGSIEMEQGDYENAVNDLNKALVYSKNDIGMTIDIYKVFAANQREAEGKSYLSAALENRLSSMSEYEKGVIYYYMSDYENARNFLEMAKSDKTYGRDSLLMLGKTYEQLGDSNYAGGLYNKYIEENGGDAVIYNQLGLCKLATGEYEMALNAFESGLKMEGAAAILQELKYNQAVAYEYVSDFKKAAALMREYLTIYPDDLQAQREYEFLKTR